MSGFLEGFKAREEGDMTIEQLLNAKRELEAELLAAMQRFSGKTNMLVSSVYIHDAENQQGTRLYGAVETELTLRQR